MTTTSAGSPSVPGAAAHRLAQGPAWTVSEPQPPPVEVALTSAFTAPIDPDWGSGLAWLSRPTGRPADGGAAGDAGSGGAARPGSVHRAPGVGIRDSGRGRAAGADGMPPPAAAGAPQSDDGGRAGPDGARGIAGGRGTGGVVTWLPDGRWVAGDAEEPEVAEVRGQAPDRRWGRRRVALARMGARIAGWPRRVMVGVLLLAAVLAGLRPDPPRTAAAPPTVDVVVAARDLPAGTPLAAADLRTVPMPVPVAPAGATRRIAGLIGRIAAGPLRRGEAVTDARIVGPGLTAGLGTGETAAVPVRIADPETAALVRAGDRVDVLATPVGIDGERPPGGDEAVEVAARLRVLAVLGGAGDPADGVVLVVAATERTARQLAGAAARHRLTVSVRPP